jgi:predicted transcriptional regulator
LSQQNEIAVLLRANTKQKDIANILGFTPSAISQEIKIQMEYIELVVLNKKERKED